MPTITEEDIRVIDDNIDKLQFLLKKGELGAIRNLFVSRFKGGKPLADKALEATKADEIKVYRILWVIQAIQANYKTINFLVSDINRLIPDTEDKEEE